MHKFLIKADYKCLYTDSSIFWSNNLIVVVYVDNILICRSNKNQIWNLKAKLNVKFTMMNCRLCKHYLKLQIIWNRSLQIFTLLQKIYLKKMILNFEFRDSKAVIISMKLRLHLISTLKTALSHCIKQYQSAINFLMYVMTQMRSDIVYVMSILSQFFYNSDKTHWKFLKKIFCYLQNTLYFNIEYTACSKVLNVLNYFNFNWEENIEMKRFISEYLF